MTRDTIEFKENIPDINDYWELFKTTGWNDGEDGYSFTKQDLENAINNSWYSISIYYEKKFVGFGRVISDGVHHALIVDLIIHPDYQGKGLGSQLLERLIEKCNIHDIRDVQLFAAKDKFGFYEGFGFEKRPVNAPGMQLKFNQLK
jgi:ribosomal protein S18 acetylase RimI-like enzyme